MLPQYPEFITILSKNLSKVYIFLYTCHHDFLPFMKLKLK